MNREFLALRLERVHLQIFDVNLKHLQKTKANEYGGTGVFS